MAIITLLLFRFLCKCVYKHAWKTRMTADIINDIKSNDIVSHNMSFFFFEACFIIILIHCFKL